MVNIEEFDKNMMNYFNTLPKYVQESIMQGHSDITNYQDLVNCCEHIMKKNTNV